MDSNMVEANWHQLRGNLRERFGKLTNDDLLEIGGKVEVLVGKLQERYDISLAEAEKMVTGLEIDQEGLKLQVNNPE